MQAEIITVGTELLLGDIVDSNTQFLSRELAAQGISVLHQSTVGDNTARLGELVRQALERSDLVVLAGGLGPTADDLTKETVCEVMGITPVLHAESWHRIIEYFENTGREMADNNQKQAMLPPDCRVFQNDHGTAPGCAIEKDGKRVVLLPGPPRELVPMFSDYVSPYLATFSEGGIYSTTVGVFGLPEASVAERISDLMTGANPTVAPYAKEGEVLLRITARAADEEAAQALCAPIVEELQNRLGAYIYGINAGSLPKVVVQMLREKGLKIATAESCTAGLLSGQITQVPGASSVFECGVAAYSCEIKHHLLGVPQDVLDEYGAVSPETARAMAVGVRRVSRAALGVSITGEAGPTPSADKPVGTVYMALADETRVWTKKLTANPASDRDHIRHLAVMNALDLTRRYLEAMPTVMAGGERVEPMEEAPAIPAAPAAGEKIERRRLRAVLLGFVAFLAAILLWLLFYFLSPTNTIPSIKPGQTEVTDAFQQEEGGGLPEGAPAGMLNEFYNLYSQNTDVAGWLAIDNTAIAYPVMKRVGNPEYYRTHTFAEEDSENGALYFGEEVNLHAADAVNQSLVVYGANAQDGSLFADLVGYMERDFLVAHPTVQMNTLFERGSWAVFGVMVVDGDPLSADAFEYARSTFGEGEFSSFVEEIRRRSLWDTDVTVTAEDRLLLMVTDIAAEAGFPNAELVVAAKRLAPAASQNSTENGTTATGRVDSNPDAVMPEKWGGTSASTSATTEESQTTTAAVSATTTTGKTSPVTQKPTTTAQKTSTTKKKTTTTTRKPTAPPVVDATGLQAGKIKESEFMKYFQIKDQKTGQVVKPTSQAALQTALARLVKMEMGTARFALHSTEAWKAQAVASYSYVLWYVGEYGSPYPFWFPTMNPSSSSADRKIYDAVGEVLGVKVADTSRSSAADMACMTMYHASSSGKTANCHRVYWENVPYLQSVSSPYDTDEMIDYYSNGADQWSHSFTITTAQLEKYITEWVKDTYGDYKVGHDTKKGEPPLYAKEYDGDSLYVTKTNWYYTKNSQKKYITGVQLREATEGKLWSHAFETDRYDEKKDSFRVTTYGYGHGVGLSQMGAVGYANEEGWNYQQILRHYYSITSQSKAQLVAPKWE